MGSQGGREGQEVMSRQEGLPKAAVSLEGPPGVALGFPAKGKEEDGELCDVQSSYIHT